MTEQLTNFLCGFNIQTIIAMAIIVWYFTKELTRDIKGSIDNLDRDVREMNTRLSRVEGSVYGKDFYKMDKQ